MSNRDTQFQNFANALYMECVGIYQDASIRGRVDTEQLVIRHITRRAYDFAVHVLENTDIVDLDRLPSDEHVERIPDMTELESNHE
ncbi:MAG TPA: hypothetical protein VF974_06080 [Patescibacteria group bacterium]